MPISAGEKSSQVVSLQGFEATGTRMDTNDLDDLIKRQNTSKAAFDALSEGTRVFIVQEVYSATSMTLHAEDSKAFNLKLASSDAVADCAQSGQSSDASKTTDTTKTANATKTTDASKTTGSGQPGTQSSKASPKPKTPSASAAQPSATPKLGAGLAFCVDNSYSLKMTSKNAIPFAVRLAELKLSGTTVERLRGSVMKQTLGGDTEISADLIDKSSPVVADLSPKGN